MATMRWRAGMAMVGFVAGMVVLAQGALGRDRLAKEEFVGEVEQAGSFGVVARGEAATIVMDGGEWAGGCWRAGGDLQMDIERVTGVKAPVMRVAQGGVPPVVKRAVIVGTIGKSAIIDRLVREKKLDVTGVAGKWESFVIQTVEVPLGGATGVERALVIAGSDKRGTIYGVYEVSEQMGVSPWYWWADVPVHKAKEVWVKAGRYVQGEPSVKYRGVFLNDEAPDLSNWVREKYGQVSGMNGVSNYGHEFYARMFEVLLRLKGNYLWPAMWNNAFNEDDAENARLADEYGIVMGTSHQEPMIRAQKEWDRRHRGVAWNYFTDAKTLEDFWREGIKRNKAYESILTLGLRGANDTPMIQGGGTLQQNMELLKEIVVVQRKMIGEEINADVTKVPQLWCPYKEVLDYYNAGLRVPEDVTILWTDDNWGDLRRLPTEEERQRSGGAGIYYHFDYVGGPRNYKWVNTNPIPKVWEQMTRAKAYGADRIWIVNVGHFKGLEFPVEFWMRLGWDSGQWTNDKLQAYTEAWAEREFGAAVAKETAEIIAGYTRMNGRRKPELIDPGTFSLVNYGEAERVVGEWGALVAKAEEVYGKVPAEARDAYFELVLFPTKASAQVTALYVAAGRNAMYAQQGRASANQWAEKVKTLFAADAALMEEYHKVNGGKWNHFMDQVHIGYTSWQDPQRNVMPRVVSVTEAEGASMGVAVEGSTEAAKIGEEVALPRFDINGQTQRWVEVYRKGKAAFDYMATPSDPWIVVSGMKGRLEGDQRVWVSIDWTSVPRGVASGRVKIARESGETYTVKVDAVSPEKDERARTGVFAEGDGVVAMEAEHFARAAAAGEVKWAKVEGYGKTLSGMTILPMTAASVEVPRPGKSPCVEYAVQTVSSGEVKVWAFLGANLNAVAGKALRYAVSIDDEVPQVVTILPAAFNAQNGNREWESGVKDNGYYRVSTHRVEKAGEHTVKVWMVDPGVVVERVIVDCGGMKPSYLGPPESSRGK